MAKPATKTPAVPVAFDDVGCVPEHPGVRTVPRDRRVPQANRGGVRALRATASLASPAI